MVQPVTELKISDGVAIIVLNRPHVHNALDMEIIEDLISSLSNLESILSIRVIVLMGNGQNFCSGADLQYLKKRPNDQSYNHLSQKMAKLMNKLYNLSKPTIAVIKGGVFGGGIGLVACCDIALASKDAHFCFSEVKLGLIPAIISPYVIKAIGSRAAQRFFLTAEQFNAKQALDMGLVHLVMNENELQYHISKITKQLKLNSPQAVSRTKQLIKSVSGTKLDEKQIEKTKSWLNEISNTDEAKEGISAFLEKRKASWVSGKDNLDDSQL